MGIYMLLKSDVTLRDHVVRCHRSHECGSRFVNFIRDGTVFAYDNSEIYNIGVHAQ